MMLRWTGLLLLTACATPQHNAKGCLQPGYSTPVYGDCAAPVASTPAVTPRTVVLIAPPPPILVTPMPALTAPIPPTVIPPAVTCTTLSLGGGMVTTRCQ